MFLLYGDGRMTLRHLKIFVTVCNLGTMTAAADALYIAQPSISLAISDLEQYYGVKLFDRISKRLQINETGKLFLQYATHIVNLFDDLEKEIKNYDSHGVIRIGSSVTIGNNLLPIYLQEFKKLYPDIALSTIIDNSETIEKHILENTIDIGLIEGQIHSPYITNEHITDDELVLICAADHPFSKRDEIDVKELDNQKFLGLHYF